MLVVTPLAGEWMEILSPYTSFPGTEVAPLAGAWIEIITPRMSRASLGCQKASCQDSEACGV